MPIRKRVEVRYIEDGRWGVYFLHPRAPTSTHDLKREAIQVARAIALREDADVLIYDAGPGHVMSPDDTI